MSEVKGCYLCGLNYADHDRNGVPVCDSCDTIHLKPAREKHGHNKKKPTKKVAPPTKEGKKDQGELELDLEWDESELETQPGWGGFTGFHKP